MKLGEKSIKKTESIELIRQIHVSGDETRMTQ